jgi:hypothetical protein
MTRLKPSLSRNAKTDSGRQGSRKRENDVIARRDRLVVELIELQAKSGWSRFLNNAWVLLTRSWSHANWRGREELLKSADWLIQMEKRRKDGLPLWPRLRR